MIKYFLLLFFVSINVVAFEQKKDLFLVVGSTRADSTEENVIGQKIHHSNATNCSHAHTWNGKATTMDCEPCENNCGEHIQSNACTFDFSPYRVKRLVFERMDTLASSVDEAGNLIGAILKNVKPHLESKALLEIELDPFLCFTAYPSTSTKEEHLAACRQQNPFTGWYSYVVVYFALIEAANEDFSEENLKTTLTGCNVSDVDEKLQAIVHSREHIRAWIEKIADITSISVETLKARILKEMEIYHQLKRLEQNNPDNIALVCLLAGGAALSCEDFATSFENREYLCPPEAYAKKLLSIAARKLDKNGIERVFHYYAINEFFSHCLSNMILGFMAVEKNKSQIVDYLSNHGFSNVEIKFGDSPHNGRRNYWLVSAINQ